MGTAGKQKRFKAVSVILVLMLVLAGIFSYVPVVQSKVLEDIQETAENENGQESDADATATLEPGVTDSPDATEEPVSTPRAKCHTQGEQQPQTICKPNKSPSPAESSIGGGAGKVFLAFCKSHLEKE